MEPNFKTSRREVLIAAAGVAAGILPELAGAQVNPVKIGFSVSMTGALAGGAKSALVARQVWRDDVNKRGGLLGRPVELVFYDDQSSPANPPSIYAKLLDIDKVDLVIAPYGSLLTAPVMPLLAQRKLLALANYSSGVNDNLKYDKFFEIAPWGNEIGNFPGGFLRLAARNGLKKVALLSVDFEAMQALVVSAKELAAKLGLEIVADQRYPMGTVEFSPLLRSLRTRAPEAVFVLSYPNDSAAIVRSINEVGVGPSVQLFGGCMIGLQFTALLESLGSQLNGIVNYHTYVPEKTMNTPGVGAFLEAYTARAIEAKVDPLGFYLAPFNYALGQVIEQAIATSRSLDNEVLARAMKTSIFKTVVGDISFDGDGQWSKGRMLQVQFQNLKDKDSEQFRRPGKQVIVDPPELASGTFLKPFEKARSKS
jgi:branched-chain amino acid transport system substrate-binding protein